MSEAVWAAVSAALIIEGCMMNVLVVDVGGTHVKILATGKKEKREFASGPRLTAPQMVLRVRKLAQDWKYQAVSIGYPGPVLHNRPVAEPRNLGGGWMGFSFEEAFNRPTKIATMRLCRRSAAIVAEKCCSSG